jgi:peptidyl-prolyl cis-trans isomerase A (cyclophilin A)
MRTFLAITFWFLLFNNGKSQNPQVIISTEVGDITVEIFSDKAPITSTNFLAYVDAGKYKNLAFFYRVVRLNNQPKSSSKIEVIQGGYYEDSTIERLQFPPIKHETTEVTGLLHKDGVISMARLGPGTASSEFFICIGSQPGLDFHGDRNPDKQGFAAFGKVINGMKIVRKIQKMKDKDQYLLKPVKILNITRVK